MQDRDAVAEAVEELAGDRRCQRDLGHQQQGAAAEREAGVDRLQIHLGLSRSGYALQQEGLKVAPSHSGFNLLVSLKLMGIERSWWSHRGEYSGRRFRLERDQLPAG